MIPDPKPVLEHGVVYMGDNGRTFCRAHAGMSALYTGRDISGQPVEVAPSEFPCETCVTVARVQDEKVLAVLRPDRYLGRTSIAEQACLSMAAVAESVTRLCRVGKAVRKAGTSAVVYRLFSEVPS